jgi:hypothetical protein
VLTPRDVSSHVYRGGSSSSARPLRLVIRNRTALDDFFTTVRIPRADWPRQIDFDTNELLIAVMGAQSSIGPTISIDSVADLAGERMVVVRSTYSAACLNGQAYRSPVDIVVVPRGSTGHVRFIERTDTLRDCKTRR